MLPRPTSLAAALAALLVGCDATPFRAVDVDLSPTARSEAPPSARENPRTLRFSVAAIESPRDTYSAYSRLFERLGNRLGMQIEFVQRRTYREVNDLLAAGKLDAALVCTGGYLDLLSRTPGAVEVLAVPVVGGGSTFESLVIVPAGGPATRVQDLEGKRFAFTDELSFTGRAYVERYLQDLGREPSGFFGAITYTHSHDRSITAVARGLVDGAAVHSHVFDHVFADDPTIGKRIRVIHRSQPFGMMPVVASTRLRSEERDRLRRVLLDLSRDPEGAAALAVLRFDGFAEAAPGLFESAARVVRR